MYICIHKRPHIAQHWDTQMYHNMSYFIWSANTLETRAISRYRHHYLLYTLVWALTIIYTDRLGINLCVMSSVHRIAQEFICFISPSSDLSLITVLMMQEALQGSPYLLPLSLCGLAESDRAFSLTTIQYRSWIAIIWLPSRYVWEALPMHLTL